MKLKQITALLFNVFMGALIAGMIGLSPAYGMAAASGASVLLAGSMPSGIFEGIYTEVWTGELVKKLRAGAEATWLDGVPDYSSRANNDVIHLVDVGADPDVLVNNTTYPIEIQNRPDSDISISLDKFQTKATRVTDDELYAISYDKMGIIVENHGEAIKETKYKKAIHALSPQTNSAKTPVLETSGEVDPVTKRIRLRREDIVALKDKFDKMRVPTEGRRLVLCTDHVNDLLLLDQKFAEQYYNYKTGKITSLYGFEVYEFVNNPFYTSAGAKVAYHTAPGATDTQASVAFYAKRMFKATGTTKMYYSEAKNSPTTQENLVNFRHYFIVLPKKQEAIAAIISKIDNTEG
ncbi:MAG: hypothetical protein PHO36_16140 [Parabacteroides sp.]|nr:hypothetical protein [Parabacteroides sp.]